MNKRSILFFPISVAAFILYSAQALAVPPVDGKGVPAVAACPPSATGTTSAVLHFDKIIFKITGDLIAANLDDQQKLNAVPHNTELDIKVKDNPRTVADLKGKVLSFLGAADLIGVPIPNRQFIEIVDVEYAVICAK